MSQCIINNQEKELILDSLKKVNNKLQGEFVKFCDTKEPIIVERRKPVVEGVLEHLNNPSITNYNVMIDAETGFGKTYDIGLWSHTLAEAGFHHLVAVPNSDLVKQAQKMIDSTFTVGIRTPKTVQEIKDALRATEPTTIIITHDLLLRQENDQKFEDQNAKLWISVDEADSINKQQAFENIQKLDKVYPTTYLTATPKRRILNRCGKIISPTRSNRRCIASTIKTTSVVAKTNKREKFSQALVVSAVVIIMPSIVLFPIIRSYVAATIGFTSNCWLCSTFISYLYFAISFVIFNIIMLPIKWLLTQITEVKSKELFLRLAANVCSLFTREESSPAHEYVEECEEVFNYNRLVDTDDLLTSIRWNVQSPIGENALILVNDIDNIINLSFALHDVDNKDGKTRDNSVLKDGKICTRYEVYNKFLPEGMLYRDYRLKLRQSNFTNCVKKQHPNLTEEQISELQGKVDFSNVAKYLKYRVMHSMIDLTLSCLTGYDNIALDKQRKEGLSGLIKDVKNKAGTADYGSITNFLKKKGFSEQFAKKKLLPQIRAVIEALNKENGEQSRLIVDNWHLSKELHDFIEEGTLRDLSDFCEQNKCIFAGLGKNDLGVDEGKPFFGLYNMPSGKGKCKVKYCSYGKSDLDTLAKYALTTIVDGSKGRGFDSEYNHVASIFTDSTSQFNDPAGALQNLGRNRERNPNRQPWFFAAADEGTELFIDRVLAKLKSAPRDFCKKFLFPATDRYNKLVKNRMGIELGQKIETYISENMDVLGNIDTIALKKFSDEQIKEIYEKVHDINDFDVGRTKKDLRKILKSTEKYLRSCEDRIKNNGKFSFTVRVGFFVISAITKAVYYIWFAFDYVIFSAKSCTLNERTDGRNVLAYAYVIRNCSLESVLRSERIFDKAFEVVEEDICQNFEDKPYDRSECMERIVGFFQNKVYINALDKSLSPLLLKKEGEKHLLTILNTIFPDEKNNEDKREKIINFRKDLERLKCKELANKYCQADLCKIVKWINDINKEATRCQAYYHSVNRLINTDEPKLKNYHHLFDVRVIYSMEAFKNSDLSPMHSKLLFFIRLSCVARFIIFVFVFPYLLELIPLIGAFLAFVLQVLVTNLSERFREFLFNENIQNDSRSAINELDLLSKQSEIKHMREAADKIAATDLSAISMQQQIASEQQGCTDLVEQLC